MKESLESIFSEFNTVTNQVVSIKPYGSGHIHDTFKVITQGRNDYLLQKINHKVFTNIPALQSNIENVINYIIAEDPDSANALEVINCINGKSFFLDENGDYWRIFVFIHKSKTYNRIITSGLAYEGGKAFGKFQNSLRKFPLEKLYETLPKFHNVDYRIELFESSLKTDIKNRVKGIEDEIEFVHSRASKMKRILELGQQNKIPLRITHNDTKINNILFNENDKAICVIDLDTVMPGYIHYDFGDAIRTGAASAREDETDLEKMYIDLDLFKSYSQGFLEQTVEMINETEINELYFAPQLLTFIIALRFLTDYLDEDVYFKTNNEEHNLQRWFAQKKLLLSMEENENEMKQIIERIVKKLKK